MMRSRWFRVVLILLCAVQLCGCAQWQMPTLQAPQPWVKPYEREALADPIMKFSADPLSAKHFEHVHTVREAARGATGVEGGGCGCN